jgi:large subunit ribosomal protein L21
VYAIISDRNRQATVREGDVILCDLSSKHAPGDEITFDQVLLVGDEGKCTVGKPTVAGATVVGQVLSHVKGKKIVAFRFKRRKNVRVKRGHRQQRTQVRIKAINA